MRFGCRLTRGKGMQVKKVVTLDRAASKVFRHKIFIEDNSGLLLLLNLVNSMCKILLTEMVPVVKVRDVPDSMNKKRPGSGQNIKKNTRLNKEFLN